MGLKADANAANGGIGVSYSNVVLGSNSVNYSPMLGDRKSSYTYEYGSGAASTVANIKRRNASLQPASMSELYA